MELLLLGVRGWGGAGMGPLNPGRLHRGPEQQMCSLSPPSPASRGPRLPASHGHRPPAAPTCSQSTPSFGGDTLTAPAFPIHTVALRLPTGGPWALPRSPHHAVCVLKTTNTDIYSALAMCRALCQALFLLCPVGSWQLREGRGWRVGRAVSAVPVS